MSRPPIAVSHSLLAPEALRAEVARAFDIGPSLDCRLLQRGFNDTYLLTTPHDRYVLRVYRAGWRSAPEIAYELELLIHLAAKGVPVSFPLCGRDGKLMRPVAAPEGPRQLALFTFAAGEPVAWDEERHSFLAGKLAGAIHAGSDDFVSPHARLPLDLAYLIDNPLATLRPFLVHRLDDWHFLEGFAARLRERTDVVAETGLDWGVCHGNLNGGNIHITRDHRLTVFDFDLCGPGWRACDFAEIQWIAHYCQKTSIWEAFLSGYAESRPPAATDLAAVPVFHAVSRLFFLGLAASNAAGRWGISCMSDWYIDYEMRFFREWEAEHRV